VFSDKNYKNAEEKIKIPPVKAPTASNIKWYFI